MLNVEENQPRYYSKDFSLPAMKPVPSGFLKYTRWFTPKCRCS